MTPRAVLLVALLGACATGYQPAGFTGGYSETRLKPDVAQVSFDGNGFTSKQRSMDFTLLRAAQLTLASGRGHFVIMGSEQATSTSYYATPQTYQIDGNTVQGSGGAIVPITKQRSGVTVLMLQDANKDSLDARFLRSSIVEKYDLPEHLEPDSGLLAALEIVACFGSVGLLVAATEPDVDEDSLRLVGGVAGATCAAALVADALDIATGAQGD